MLIIRCGNPNSAERELIEQLKPLDGVAIIGYTVNNSNGREREIDAILLTPVRAAVIEAKAPKIATPSEGELEPKQNSPWTIAGEIAQFHGSHSPNEQARLNAQILAQYIKAKKVPRTPFIQSAVSVSGDDLTMEKPVMVGQTAVGLVEHILEALDLMLQKPITLSMALDFIDALDLGVFKPTEEGVTQEWENSEKQFESIPTDKSVDIAKKKAKTASNKKDSKADKWGKSKTKLTDFFAAFIAIFLLTFFLDGLGVIDYTKEAFSELFVGADYEQPNIDNEQAKAEEALPPGPEISPDASVSETQLSVIADDRAALEAAIEKSSGEIVEVNSSIGMFTVEFQTRNIQELLRLRDSLRARGFDAAVVPLMEPSQ